MWFIVKPLSREFHGELYLHLKLNKFIFTVTEFKEMKTVVEDIEPLELAADEDVEQQQEPHNKER